MKSSSSSREQAARGGCTPGFTWVRPGSAELAQLRPQPQSARRGPRASEANRWRGPARACAVAARAVRAEGSAPREHTL
eukprot:6988260-Lingulodinium_polyedra.AAC.1